MPARKRPALALPDSILGREDVVRFFLFLDRIDHTSFHPDERFWTPEGGVQYVNRAGTPSYTVPEAKLRDRLMEQAWKLSHQEDLDLYEIALVVSGIDSTGPAWIQKAMNKILRSASRKYWDPA